MRLIKEIKDVRQFNIYRGLEIIAFKDKVLIGDKELDATERDDYYVDNGVLAKRDRGEGSGKHSIYVNDHFEDFPIKYESLNRFSPEEYYSSVFEDDGSEKYYFYDYGKEYYFTINESQNSYLASYDSYSSIFMIPLLDNKTLVFYTKTGERLWEYKEEYENLKINGRCIPVVDDVVVVISMKGLNPKKIQGFDIRSGNRLWETTMESGVSNTLFLGPDNMLYGCKSVWIKPLVSSRLMLTKLNPFTGELDLTVVSEGECFDVMPWNVTMHGNKLYYTDNRRGNEIGVIDVDKKELVDRMPLNIDKKVTIGAPVVTDDKVYVFIRDLQELRVFEKEEFASEKRASDDACQTKLDSPAPEPREEKEEKIVPSSVFDKGYRVCTRDGLRFLKINGEEYQPFYSSDVIVNCTYLMKSYDLFNESDIQEFYNEVSKNPFIDGIRLGYGRLMYNLSYNDYLEDLKKTSYIAKLNYSNPINFIWPFHKVRKSEVESFYEYSVSIVIKGVEVSKFDDAGVGYIGYPGSFPEYMDISSSGLEDDVVSLLPKEEIKEIKVGNGHDGFVTVSLIPKKFIEKIVLRRKHFNIELVEAEEDKQEFTGKDDVYVLNPNQPDNEVLELMKKFGFMELK